MPRGAILENAAPAVPPERLAAHLRDFYGFTGALMPLDGERDQNAALSTPDGRRFVVKVAHPAEEPGLVELQSSALRHLAKVDPALPVPRLVETMSGHDFVDIPIADGRRRILRVLTYLEGKSLGGAPPSMAQHVALGRTLGRLDAGLSGFSHPAQHHRLLWDLANAGDVRSHLTIAQPERRAVITRILETFTQDVHPRLARLRRQVVHNDFNPHNILVDSSHTERVVGVIDFGDVVHTALVNDVAIAASYLMRHPGGPAAVAEFVGGYVQERPLDPDEVELLPDLVATRLAMVVAIAERRAAEQPSQRQYILRNHAGALAGLARLEGLSRPVFVDALRRAAKLG